MIEVGLQYYVSESQCPKKFEHHTTVTKSVRAAIDYVRTAKIDKKSYYVYRIRTTPHYLFEAVDRKPQPITPTIPPRQPKQRKRREASIGVLDLLGIFRKGFWPRWKME